MICNIGIGLSSTHAKKLKAARYVKYHNFVFIPTHNLEFPLKHPSICIPDVEYDNLVYKCVKGNIFKYILRKIKRNLGR